ncbi:hypothetical protein GALMADRAFT_104136, partial [Galerina marginata CBS 339.88]
MDSGPVPALDIHGTLGALSVGVLLGCFLFGITTLQVYMYYLGFPGDRVRTKALVGVI